MTTEETLKHIRSGMKLISHAMSDVCMNHNSGFTNGQISMSFAFGIISTQDWKQLKEEAQEARAFYKSNNILK